MIPHMHYTPTLKIIISPAGTHEMKLRGNLEQLNILHTILSTCLLLSLHSSYTPHTHKISIQVWMWGAYKLIHAALYCELLLDSIPYWHMLHYRHHYLSHMNCYRSIWHICIAKSILNLWNQRREESLRILYVVWIKWIHELRLKNICAFFVIVIMMN